VKIEAVVVCVNYADFLAHSLPANRSHFNNMVVVTDSKDQATVDICNKYNVRCIRTDAFYENGNKFNKAAGINVGLKALQGGGWTVHLDADIVLPPLFRSIIERLPLDESKMYGLDRYMCPSYEAWMKYLESGRSCHERWAFLHLNLFPMGTRLVQYGDYMEDGSTPDMWLPIGYFQMWFRDLAYPAEHGAADRTDVLHAKHYDRAHRELIPEIAVIHLESEPALMGTNWEGRQTARFAYAGPTAQESMWTQFLRIARGYITRALTRLVDYLKRVFGPPNYR